MLWILWGPLTWLEGGLLTQVQTHAMDRDFGPGGVLDLDCYDVIYTCYRDIIITSEGSYIVVPYIHRIPTLQLYSLQLQPLIIYVGSWLL